VPQLGFIQVVVVVGDIAIAAGSVTPLTLDSCESLPEPKDSIDLGLVQRTITTDQLVEDMEVQLGPVFRKGSDLRLQAVKLLMFLEESGPRKQTELVEELGMEDYAMSRLLEVGTSPVHCSSTRGDRQTRQLTEDLRSRPFSKGDLHRLSKTLD
jgi:hypothetical protein